MINGQKQFMRKILAVLPLLLFSCNQSRVTELEKENDKLKSTVSSMQDQIAGLNNTNQELVYKNYKLSEKISTMCVEMQSICMYANNAKSHINSAVFWSSESKFLCESEMNCVTSNINDIVNIASRY